MGKLGIVSIPAALALALLGSTVAPGTPTASSSRAEAGLGGPMYRPAAEIGRAGVAQPVRPIGDFNGDGFADLAVGAPFEDASGKTDGGALNVIYGSSEGLVTAGNQYWDQNSEGIGEAVESSDQFGFAATAGDFNVDGFADLAVGVPFEDAPADSGAVNVIYGSASGLSAAGNQVWTQNSPGIGDGREAWDEFGRALAAADFNNDGAADLAIGVPYEGITRRHDVGAVNVIYGSPTGLTSAGSQVWRQDTPGMRNAPGTGDLFGFSLVAGDFNGDMFSDLAVGVPGEDPPRDSGAVSVIHGSASGLTAAGNQLWTQNSPGIVGGAEAADLFGYSLAAGDFNDDSFGDLVVGVPFEDVVRKLNGGAVNVIYGTAGGLAAAGNQAWSQDNPGIRGAAKPRDEFGFSLAAEDFNGDGADDLALGIPGEDPPSNAGSVAVIFGGPSGLTSAGNELWSQAQLGGTAEVWDAFGFSLVAGRFDVGAGVGTEADLAIGVPLEDVGTKEDAGAVNVVYGSPGGLDPATRQLWTQDVLGRLAERGDRFGFAGGGHLPG